MASLLEEPGKDLKVFRVHYEIHHRPCTALPQAAAWPWRQEHELPDKRARSTGSVYPVTGPVPSPGKCILESTSVDAWVIYWKRTFTVLPNEEERRPVDSHSSLPNNSYFIGCAKWQTAKAFPNVTESISARPSVFLIYLRQTVCWCSPVLILTIWWGGGGGGGENSVRQ